MVGRNWGSRSLAWDLPDLMYKWEEGQDVEMLGSMEKLLILEKAEPSWVTEVGILAQNLSDVKEEKSWSHVGSHLLD